jgi:hypothetical protein
MHVKNFKGQRSTAIHVSEPFNMTCSGVDELKLKLWEFVNSTPVTRSYIKGKAVIPDNPEEHCSVQENNFENFESFIVFKKSGHEYGLNEINNERLELFDRATTAITMWIYSYSVNIGNAALWTRFSKDCIQPQQVDRAGAATNNQIQDIMGRLQTRWRGMIPIGDLHIFIRMSHRNLFWRSNSMETLGNNDITDGSTRDRACY